MTMMMWRRKATFIAVVLASCLMLFHLQGLLVKKLKIDNMIRNDHEIVAWPTEKRSSTRTIKPCPLNKDKETFAALLRYWDFIAKRHNISYVIGLGSLLGQHRRQDIIPWDDDVDVLVDVKHFKILKPLGEQLAFRQGWDRKFHVVVQPDFEKEKKSRRRWSCTGKQVSFQVDRCAFVGPMARVIMGYNALDVFPYVDKYNIVFDVEMEKNYSRAHFFPFQTCSFMNVSTWCPKNTRAVLESAYEDLAPDYACRNGRWVILRNKTLEIESAIEYLKRLIIRIFNFFKLKRSSTVNNS